MPRRKITPAYIAAHIRRVLKDGGSAPHAEGVQHFFKEEVQSRGWYTGELRKVAVRFRRTIKRERGLEFLVQVADRSPCVLVKIASLSTWVCAILNHVSSRPLGVALARPCRSFRWRLDPGWISFPRSNPSIADCGERRDPVPAKAVGLLPRAPDPSATAYRLRPIFPGFLVTAVRLEGGVGDRQARDPDWLAS